MLFVILVFIVLLRLLISMFNETYAGVQKSRERIWRIQRGQFLLTAERRLLMLCKIQHHFFKWMPSLGGSGEGKVRATLGQRLVCRMWLGEVDEVSTRSYTDASGAVRLMRKHELEALSEEYSAADGAKARKVHWLAQNSLLKYDAEDFQQEEWSLQPTWHSNVFQGESIEAALAEAVNNKRNTFVFYPSSEIRAKELASRNETRLKNKVNAKR